MVVQRIFVKEVKLLRILGDPPPLAETIHKVVFESFPKVIHRQRCYYSHFSKYKGTHPNNLMATWFSIWHHFGSKCTTFGHHSETILRVQMDNFETTVGQLRDNFEITWKRLYFTFGPHGDFVVTISGASSCLVASIWSLLILQLAFKCALCFKPFFYIYKLVKWTGQKIWTGYWIKGAASFSLFSHLFFPLQEDALSYPLKVSEAFNAVFNADQKSINVFCNSCLVGFVCNIF